MWGRAGLMDSCHGFSVQHVHWPLRIQAEMKNDPEHTEARSIKWTISYSELRFLRLKTLQSPWGGKSFLPEGLQRDPNDLALHWRVMQRVISSFNSQSGATFFFKLCGMAVVGSLGWSRISTSSVVHYTCEVISLLSFYHPPRHSSTGAS